MKAITLLLIGAFCLGSLSANAQDYITVYYDGDYRGASHRLYEGEYRADELGVGNDKISSIRVPRGVKAIVYSDNDFRGKSKTIDGNEASLSSDWNDKISSIRVERSYNNNNHSSNHHSSNSRDMVTLYVDSNYRGNNQQFGDGSYNASDIGLPNDAISSIRVPSGMSVTVYTDDHHRGRSETYSSDIRALSYDFNDKITSIRVQPGYSGYRESSSSRNYEDEGDPTNPNPNYRHNNYSSGQVILYRDCDYKGLYKAFKEGGYTARDLGLVGNDNLSSLRVPSGWEVILYTDDGLQGRSTTITRDNSCLNSTFNDRISSIEVRRR